VHWLGTDNGNGAPYLFYSGIFAVLVFAVGQLANGYANARRHNCHEPRCWRVGRVHVDDKGTLSCFRHHPEGKPERGHIRERYNLYLGERPGDG
jgi:hypothetical protein